MSRKNNTKTRRPQALKKTSGRAQKMSTMVDMDLDRLKADGYRVVTLPTK